MVSRSTSPRVIVDVLERTQKYEYYDTGTVFDTYLCTIRTVQQGPYDRKKKRFFFLGKQKKVERAGPAAAAAAGTNFWVQSSSASTHTQAAGRFGPELCELSLLLPRSEGWGAGGVGVPTERMTGDGRQSWRASASKQKKRSKICSMEIHII